MKAENEQELLQQWKTGSREAFGELFGQNAPRLYSFAYRLTGQSEDAMDILQSAALKAFSSGCPGRDGTNFYAWMRRVVLNLFLDREKGKKRAGRQSLVHGVDWQEIEAFVAPGSQPTTPRAELEERRRMQTIERALDDLPPDYRTVVVLRDMEGLSYEEISTIQSIPLETVRTRLRRARERLRESLASLVHE